MLGAMITEDKTILFALPNNKSSFVNKEHIVKNQLGWIRNSDTTYGYIEGLPISRYFVGDVSFDEMTPEYVLPIEEIDRNSVGELFGLLKEEPKKMNMTPTSTH